MKKADNFDASKWLVENKITFQSRLNEEVSDDVKQFLNNEFEIYLEGGDSFEEEPGETHVFTMEEDDERYKDDELFNSAINQLQNNPIILDYNKNYTGDYGKVIASANVKNIFISFIVPEDLNESKLNEEFSDDFPSLDYNTITNFIKSKGYKITSDYYDGGFDINDGEYFIGVFDDHIAVTDGNGQVKDIPFNESRLNEAESIVDFKKWKSTLMPFYEEVIKEINQPDMSLNIYSRWVGDFIKYCNTYTSYDNLIKYGFYVQDIKTDEDLKDQLVKFIKYHI
jgi:hypothetical protein